MNSQIESLQKFAFANRTIKHFDFSDNLLEVVDKSDNAEEKQFDTHRA